MLDWNIIATAEPGRDRDLLQELNQLGEFRRPGFRGVLVGRVADVHQFLEAVRLAAEQRMKWADDLARALPGEQLFHFTPETFEEQLKEAVAPFVERMAGGTFYVRLERRGLRVGSSVLRWSERWIPISSTWRQVRAKPCRFLSRIPMTSSSLKPSAIRAAWPCSPVSCEHATLL
jgi:hypothetical protein